MTAERLDTPTEAPPITPGEVLRDELRKRHGIKQDTLATALGVSRFTVSQIINGQRAVTAETALRLARVLGTSPGFWLTLQNAVDLYWARRRIGDEIAQMPPLLPKQGDEPRPRPLEDLTRRRTG